MLPNSSVVERPIDHIEVMASFDEEGTLTFETVENLILKGERSHCLFLVSHDWSKVLAFIGECLPQKADGTPDTEQEKSDVVHEGFKRGRIIPSASLTKGGGQF